MSRPPEKEAPRGDAAVRLSGLVLLGVLVVAVIGAAWIAIGLVGWVAEVGR